MNNDEKRKRAVKPIVDVDEYKCGNCGYSLEQQKLIGNTVLVHWQYKYCPQCGIDCDGVWHADDWFCADGERRETND